MTFALTNSRIAPMTYATFLARCKEVSAEAVKDIPARFNRKRTEAEAEARCALFMRMCKTLPCTDILYSDELKGAHVVRLHTSDLGTRRFPWLVTDVQSEVLRDVTRDGAWFKTSCDFNICSAMGYGTTGSILFRSGRGAE